MKTYIRNASFALVLVSANLCGATFSFPDKNFSLDLPGDWTTVAEADLAALNEMLRSRPETASTQYHSKIIKNTSSTDPLSYPTFVLVQVIDGTVSPETFVSMFPKIKENTTERTASVMDDLGAHATLGTATFDPGSNSVTVPIEGTDGEGRDFSGISVIIPTKNKLICLHAYADRRTAKEELLPLVPSLQQPKITAEYKVSSEWNARVKQAVLRAITGRRQKGKE